jgi:hypothetical protein
MNTMQMQMRGWLVWAVPFALLLLIILWQVDWGRAFHREPPAESGLAPQPIMLSVLPEYRPLAPGEALKDAVERTLFNPTRRPAPTALAEAAKPRMQRGQFALAGTLVVDGKATAFLRETQGGKSRRVAQGESVNGMTVVEIKPDRVKLVLGDESEELPLKIASGPRTTIQPVVAAPGAGGPITATAQQATPNPAIPGARDVAEVLAERRRAARAQEMAAQGLPPGAPIPIQNGQPAPVTGNTMPPVPTAGPSNDPQWQGVYQRYQQPRR